MKIYFIIAVLLLAGSTQAATLTVCPNGCEYSSIQAAVDAASPGDTIQIHSGKYQGPIYVDKANISFVGINTGGGKPTISGGGITGHSNIVGSSISNIDFIFDQSSTGYTSMLSVGKLPDKRDNSAVAGTLLYSDDFSNIKSGWSTISPDPNTASVGYKNGRYLISVFQKDIVSSSCLPTNFKDFIVQVEARLDGGSDECDYGVILRRMDEDNYYRFVITGEGNYGFIKRQNGKWVGLIPGASSSAIHIGKATNLIKVECKGNEFAFYVNGIKLNEFTDKSFASGLIGLEATPYNDKGLQVSFDNLKVWAL